MNRPVISPLLAFVLLLVSASLMLPACSDDDPGITDPIDEDPIPNTPAIPTVDSPQDELPAVSDFLSVESGELETFSPDLDGATAVMLDPLNEAHVIDFRLLPSRNLIIHEGHPCYPENLQFGLGGNWYGLVRSSTPVPLTHLGAFAGSHYYLFDTPTRWMFADVNCRTFGGHLAAITSNEESEFVASAVRALDETLAYYIGLTDWGFANGAWIWTSGETYEWADWQWAPGEPNNSGNGEEFVYAYATGDWNDTVTSHSDAYVLEVPEQLPDLGEDEVPCAQFGNDFLYLDALAAPTVTPHIERRVYWQKVFQVTIGAGATYSEEHSYTHGTSETTGMSFGMSIGISTSAGWGPVSAAIETEFHQDFNHEVTISNEETFTKTYSATAPANKIMVMALWQLRERFVIADSGGNAWSDPKYILAGPLPYLDQGLQQEYVQTMLFDQP